MKTENTLIDSFPKGCDIYIYCTIHGADDIACCIDVFKVISLLSAHSL